MLSVIIPTFNEGSGVVACVTRLSSIDHIAEIIVVDSSDDQGSINLLATLDQEDVRVVHSQGKGRAVQMNQGASLAKADAVLFLHCDTVLPFDATTLIAGSLQKSSWGRFDVRLDAAGWQFRMIESMMNLRSRLTTIATGDQAIFARKSFFIEQGGFAAMPLMEDIEFSRRAGARNKPALIDAKVTTSARRWQKNGVWRTILLMWKLRLLFRLGTSPDRLAEMYQHAR